MTASYPELSDVESVVPLSSENILVAQTDPGVYQITLGEGITFNYEQGKDIPAHGSVRIDWSDGGESEYYLNGIKWNLSSEQLKEKFGKPYTGNEYQEYLSNK